MSKKRWIVAIAVVVVAGLGFAGWQFVSGQQEAVVQAQETATVRQDTLQVVIEGTGSLAPRAEIQLAFLSGGQVAEVLVEEGQVVDAGQPLVRLEPDDLELDVARAEASLASAEGQLAQLLASPRPEEVAAQEANLAAAQGQVSAAVASRDQVTAGPDASAIASAEAQVATAEMDYRAALRTYDSIDKKTDEDRKEQARYDLWAAEIALDAARTQLDVLLAGADTDEVRAAQADVAAAVAQRDATQAQLDLLLAGSTEEQVQAAEAAVDQARVALDQAQLQLERATLTAPWEGTVTSLDVEIGEMVNPVQPVIVLSDLTALEVDVSLDETDVCHVSVGQDAQVSVDALPGVGMVGQVTYVAPKGDTFSGVVLYPVTVCLMAGGPSTGSGKVLPVRAGMTADVEITAASQEGALIVPLRAIHTEGGRAYVDRLDDGKVERVEVTLGIVTDTEAEVTGGLDEGDVVVVVSAPTQNSGERLLGPLRVFGGGD
jgi:HlyD family secretion protein